MSRSHRKTPIYGISTAHSEKLDKRIWHKRMRARERERLHYALCAPDSHLSTEPKEVSNLWSMAKDGRQWWPWHKQISHAERRFPFIEDRSDAETERLRQREIARQRSK